MEKYCGALLMILFYACSQKGMNKHGPQQAEQSWPLKILETGYLVGTSVEPYYLFYAAPYQSIQVLATCPLSYKFVSDKQLELQDPHIPEQMLSKYKQEELSEPAITVIGEFSLTTCMQETYYESGYFMGISELPAYVFRVVSGDTITVPSVCRLSYLFVPDGREEKNEPGKPSSALQDSNNQSNNNPRAAPQPRLNQRPVGANGFREYRLEDYETAVVKTHRNTRRKKMTEQKRKSRALDK